MKNHLSSSLLLLAMQLLGCTVDVQPTDNGLMINVQCASSSPEEEPTDEQPSDEELSTDDTSAADEPRTDEPGVDEPSTIDPGIED